MSNTSLINPEVRIPEIPAKQTSAFFDSINNLEPVKFSPGTAGEHITSGTMHEGYDYQPWPQLLYRFRPIPSDSCGTDT